MYKKCLVNLHQILHICEWRYIRKTPWTTIMSPCDKMLIIEFSVAKDIFFYTVWMYFSLYKNGVQWKWETKAIKIDQLWPNHHNSSKFVPLWQNPFYDDFAPSNSYFRPATTKFVMYKSIFVSQSYIVSLISTKM